MRTNPLWLPITVLGALLATTPAHAQNAKPAPTPAPLAGQAQPAPLAGQAQPAPSPAPAPAGPSTGQALGPLVPLDVVVVVNRYQGEKRVSTLPYNLAVNANDRTISSLRMGARVPVQRAAGLVGGPGFAQVEYQSVGTDIDCFARTMDDGRFQVNLIINDSSIYENVPGSVKPSADDNSPVFRSFKSTNTLVLRDGQTRQFTAATDRVNGEVVRIEVTLRVVK
jgi:hypothetical protein